MNKYLKVYVFCGLMAGSLSLQGQEMLEFGLYLESPSGSRQAAEAGCDMTFDLKNIRFRADLAVPLDAGPAGTLLAGTCLPIDLQQVSCKTLFLEIPGKLRAGTCTEASWLALACGSSMWSSLPGLDTACLDPGELVQGTASQGWGASLGFEWDGVSGGVASLSFLRRIRRNQVWDVMRMGMGLEFAVPADPLSADSPPWMVQCMVAWAFGKRDGLLVDQILRTEWFDAGASWTWGAVDMMQAALSCRGPGVNFLCGSQISRCPDGTSGVDVFGLGRCVLIREGRRNVLVWNSGIRAASEEFRTLVATCLPQPWDMRTDLQWSPAADLGLEFMARCTGADSKVILLDSPALDSLFARQFLAGEQQARLGLDWQSGLVRVGGGFFAALKGRERLFQAGADMACTFGDLSSATTAVAVGIEADVRLTEGLEVPKLRLDLVPRLYGPWGRIGLEGGFDLSPDAEGVEAALRCRIKAVLYPPAMGGEGPGELLVSWGLAQPLGFSELGGWQSGVGSFAQLLEFSLRWSARLPVSGTY